MLTYEQIKNYYQDGTEKKISKVLSVEPQSESSIIVIVFLKI